MMSGSRLARDADGACRRRSVGPCRSRGVVDTRARAQARDAIGAFVRSGGGVLVAASPEIEPGVLGAMFDLKMQLAGIEENTGAGRCR